MRILLSVFFILLVQMADAQAAGNPLIDSLIREIPNTGNDTAKARLYKRIAEEYSNHYPAEALQYANIGLRHVSLMRWKKGIAVFHHLIGMVYCNQGNYDSAVERYNKAYAVHLAEKDYFNAASTLNNTGTAYLRKGVSEKATQYYFEGLKLAEKAGNQPLIATSLSNIASVYFNQSNYDKSLEYESRALKIHQAANNAEGITASYSSIANTYQNKKDTAVATKYYQQALDEYRKAEDLEGIATVYTNLALLITDVPQKLDYQLKAQAIWDQLGPAFMTSLSNMGNTAYTYIDMARLHTARRQEYLQKAKDLLDNGISLCLQNNDKANYSFLTGVRSEVEAAMGDYPDAYHDLKTFHDLNDSIYSQDNKNKIAAIEGRREVELRDKEIELNKLALSAQKRQAAALLVVVALLLVIGILLYRQSRLRKKTNHTLVQLNSELDEANKQKARFFAILSHDLRSPIAYLVDFLHLQKASPGLLSAEQTAVHQQEITVSAEALLENMETMLLWSKEQMDHFKPDIQAVAVSTLFDYLQKNFTNLNNLRFVCSDPLHLSAQTDENYIQVIMYNLTSNAIKALKDTVDPIIEWKASQENGKTVLSITDNGPGMSEASQLVIQQQNTVYNNKTGLGLHLVRDLAKAIQCRITVESKPGSGTTFYLYL